MPKTKPVPGYYRTDKSIHIHLYGNYQPGLFDLIQRIDAARETGLV